MRRKLCKNEINFVKNIPFLPSLETLKNDNKRKERKIFNKSQFLIWKFPKSFLSVVNRCFHT